MRVQLVFRARIPVVLMLVMLVGAACSPAAVPSAPAAADPPPSEEATPEPTPDATPDSEPSEEVTPRPTPSPTPEPCIAADVYELLTGPQGSEWSAEERGRVIAELEAFDFSPLGQAHVDRMSNILQRLRDGASPQEAILAFSTGEIPVGGCE